MPPKTYRKYTNKSSPLTNPSLLTNTISSNTKYLIIVESPSKCTKIEHFLGLEYACIASNGHIQSINGLVAIDTKTTFMPTFTQIPDKQDHVNKMRDIISKFPKENIILATDDDREGEAIAWHICNVFDLPIETTPRIIFHEITKPALERSVQTQTIINMDLVCAQHARQVLDIIIGYSVSPFLWKYLYNNTKNALSAGRCQTPALRLVYDNDVTSRTGDKILKYKIKGIWTNLLIPFHLSKEFNDKEASLDFLIKTKTYKHIMDILLSKEVTRAPPTPFNTSRLLQSASNILKISPKETMRRCQLLYQNGLITYMRTESTEYSKVFVDKMGEYIVKIYGSEKYVRSISEITNTDTNLPHEAVRVTNINDLVKIEDKSLSSLYNLILKNTIESCMSPARISATEVRISAPDNTYYSYINEVPIWLGWLKYSNNSETDDQNNPSSQLLLFKSIISNENYVEYNNIICEVVSRNTHSHYTEASLINKLETLGIGRPSTYASIVDIIQERGYVTKQDIVGTLIPITEYELEGTEITTIIKDKLFGAEKQKLVIQSIGTLTIEFLIINFDYLFTYKYTENMENQLDTIRYNSEDRLEICKETMRDIKKMTNRMSRITKQTFLIEAGYEYMFGKYGQVIKHTLDDGTIEYLSVKRDINFNLDKIKNGEYTLDDILEIKSRYLGVYEGTDAYIKIGKYGAYVEYGEYTECIKSIKVSVDEIGIGDFKKHMNTKLTSSEINVPILRELTPNMSVRKGKYGAYVYYRRLDMKVPKFLNVKKCPIGYLKCEVSELVEWLCKTYKLPKE
jgi:DNA topoisomerase-1